MESARQSGFLKPIQKEKLPDLDTNAQVAGIWQIAPSQSAAKLVKTHEFLSLHQFQGWKVLILYSAPKSLWETLCKSTLSLCTAIFYLENKVSCPGLFSLPACLI